MSKRWNFKPLPTEEAVRELSSAINVNADLAKLLLQRGIRTHDEAKEFFCMELSGLHYPFLMKDMEKAVERLNEAVRRKEKIRFYGDYDVDGTTAVALCISFFHQFYEHVDFYVPDRYSEGYGVSQRGIEQALEDGVKLLVTLDCGIKSFDKVEWCNQHGIDCIICDHHKPETRVPPAVAVLDAKQHDCSYPYKELTGCGVGFKLMHAFCLKNNIDEAKVFQFIDYVAISIAADIVPITGENRILMHKGLEIINQSPRIGVKALIEVAGFKSALDVSDVVFGLAPRINAAGRIAHAYQAVKLLIADSEEEAKEYAKVVDQRNTLRKDYDQQITTEALQMIVDLGWEHRKTTVLFKQDWHKGVVGIVASRCIEKYHRPTIILTDSNGKIVGSARSVPGFDIHEAIAACEELLLQFGGHTHAAGLALPPENLAAFQEKFEQVVAATIAEECLVAKIDVDLVIRLERITEKFYQIIQRMQPFGPGNMQPMFVSTPVVPLPGTVQVMKEKHFRCLVKHTDGTIAMSLVAFNMVDDYLDFFCQSEPLAICYQLRENEFNGQKSLQLLLRDVKLASEVTMPSILRV